jgi:hypothetical protein
MLWRKLSSTPEPRAGQANKESGRVSGYHACSAEGLPPALKRIQLSHMDSYPTPLQVLAFPSRGFCTNGRKLLSRIAQHALLPR